MGFRIFILFGFCLFLCFPLFLRAVAAQLHLGRSHWNSIRTPLVLETFSASRTLLRCLGSLFHRGYGS